MGSVQATHPQPVEQSRRTFYVSAIFGLWGVISAALGIPAALYLLFPPKAKKQDEWIDLGDVSRLQPGVPVEMVFRRNRKDGWKIVSEKSTAWLVRQGNEVVAYGPQCTHLGCAYRWEDEKKQFLCPCHASFFALDGKVVSGPAPRPLDRFETKLENNRLMIGGLKGSQA